MMVEVTYRDSLNLNKSIKANFDQDLDVQENNIEEVFNQVFEPAQVNLTCQDFDVIYTVVFLYTHTKVFMKTVFSILPVLGY